MKRAPARRNQHYQEETEIQATSRIKRDIAEGKRCRKCWLLEPHECDTRTVVDYATARKAGPWDVPKGNV